MGDTLDDHMCGRRSTDDNALKSLRVLRALVALTGTCATYERGKKEKKKDSRAEERSIFSSFFFCSLFFLYIYIPSLSLVIRERRASKSPDDGSFLL